jgi:hypothetical protein
VNEPITPQEKLDRALVLEVAGRHRLDDRTLARALRGAKIKGYVVAERVRHAVEEYRQRSAATAAAPPTLSTLSDAPPADPTAPTEGES